jgi:CRISPR-associated protein Csb2
VPRALLISVAFVRGAYSGGELGTLELLPSPARLHAAFTSAAGGGPWAEVDGRLLIAPPSYAAAVRWLEEHEPLGLIAPAARPTTYAVSRYRLRAAPEPYNNETSFEPLSALDGPVIYAWPEPDEAVRETLGVLAREITHVGRADSIAIVDVATGNVDTDAPGFLAAAPGRGAGLALRVPTQGRFEALVSSHADAAQPGPHGLGSRGKQAGDIHFPGVEERHTQLRRFVSSAPVRWPFAEAWCLQLPASLPAWLLRAEWRVPVAVAVHRALVAAIGSDVPSFVTGRDGEEPLRGSGHLAIHVVTAGEESPAAVVLGLPGGVAEADRAMLIDALQRRPRFRISGRTFQLGPPELRPAVPFWDQRSRLMATEVPMVLDAPGVPRRGAWTLEDAVICSIGYALRGVLEREGIEWGAGWEFRRALVAALRNRGVAARARRVTRSASRYSHRARVGDLLVAVDALVSLGELAQAGGLLALGRSRHVGGGLLRPVDGAVR